MENSTFVTLSLGSPANLLPYTSRGIIPASILPLCCCYSKHWARRILWESLGSWSPAWHTHTLCKRVNTTLCPQLLCTHLTAPWETSQKSDQSTKSSHTGCFVSAKIKLETKMNLRGKLKISLQTRSLAIRLIGHCLYHEEIFLWKPDAGKLTGQPVDGILH